MKSFQINCKYVKLPLLKYIKIIMSGVLSSLFDLSGFFFMFTLNLLVICLVCYYFKRRIETLEHAQMEQSKILRTYIQETTNMNVKQEVRQETVQDAINFENNDNNANNANNDNFNDLPFKKIEINQFTLQQDEDSQSEDTSDDEDEDEDEDYDVNLGENIEIMSETSNIKVLRLNSESDDDDGDSDDGDSDDGGSDDGDDDVIKKNINIDVDYNKLTAKDLKAICKEKALTGFNNLKKIELVELLKKTTDIKQQVVEEIESPTDNTLEVNNVINETAEPVVEISLDVIET